MEIPKNKLELDAALKKYHIEGKPELLKLAMFFEKGFLTDEYRELLRRMIYEDNN